MSWGFPPRSDVASVWAALELNDPTLLDNFESFLTEVVEELHQSQSARETMEHHVKKCVCVCVCVCECVCGGGRCACVWEGVGVHACVLVCVCGNVCACVHVCVVCSHC